MIAKLFKKCRRTDTSFILLLIRFFYYKLRKKNILAHQRVTIKGLENIETGGLLSIGFQYVGFTHRSDVTLLNIKGRLKIKGKYSIGRGTRMDVGTGATVTIGDDGFINPFAQIIIMHHLEIGDKCAISWNCQLLDSDFHEISYPGKKSSGKGIKIGNNVWVGANAHIYKGTIIPNGTVIAADSVVRGVFTEENTIIAGNPAKVIKRDVKWIWGEHL